MHAVLSRLVKGVNLKCQTSHFYEMTSSSAIVQPVLYNDDFSSTINDEEDGNESILFHDSAKTLKLDPYYALLSETAEAAMHGLKDSTDFILEFIAPIIWCVIFVAIMDRESFVGKTICIYLSCINCIDRLDRCYVILLSTY